MTYAPKIGVFAMDPGTTTGVAWSSFLLDKSKSVGEMIRPFDSLEVPCMDRDALSIHPSLAEIPGIRAIVGLYLQVRKGWFDEGIASARHYFVYEDFVLRGQVGSTDRTGISAARITSGVITLLWKRNLTWVAQTPSDAKGRWTNDRLRNAGLWTVGSEHRRDATRHLALFATRKQGQKF